MKPLERELVKLLVLKRILIFFRNALYISKILFFWLSITTSHGGIFYGWKLFIVFVLKGFPRFLLILLKYDIRYIKYLSLESSNNIQHYFSNKLQFFNNRICKYIQIFSFLLNFVFYILQKLIIKKTCRNSLAVSCFLNSPERLPKWFWITIKYCSLFAFVMSTSGFFYELVPE